MELKINLPDGLHPDTVELVTMVAETMAAKLYRSQVKYGLEDGWKHPPKGHDGVQDGRVFHDRKGCLNALYNHLNKGDVVDCINYLGFMLHFGWSSKLDEPIDPAPYFRGFRVLSIGNRRIKRVIYQAGEEASCHFDYLKPVIRKTTHPEDEYNKEIDLRVQEYLRNALNGER